MDKLNEKDLKITNLTDKLKESEGFNENLQTSNIKLKSENKTLNNQKKVKKIIEFSNHYKFRLFK